MIFCGTDEQLYAGTVADFSGMDPLIRRDPLRSEQYDATKLNGKLISRIVFFFLDS